MEKSPATSPWGQAQGSLSQHTAHPCSWCTIARYEVSINAQKEKENVFLTHKAEQMYAVCRKTHGVIHQHIKQNKISPERLKIPCFLPHVKYRFYAHTLRAHPHTHTTKVEERWRRGRGLEAVGKEDQGWWWGVSMAKIHHVLNKNVILQPITLYIEHTPVNRIIPKDVRNHRAGLQCVSRPALKKSLVWRRVLHLFVGLLEREVRVMLISSLR